MHAGDFLGVLLLSLLVCCAVVLTDGFAPRLTTRRRRLPLVEIQMSATGSDLPTMDELSSDSFMKQVEHGFNLASELRVNPESEELKLLIKTQLGHSDGIRGFMVSYLTTDDSPAEDETIPNSLQEVLEELIAIPAAAEDLIPLICMNVIMPTAMVTLHQDEEQSQSSARTANRGIRVLRAIASNAAVHEHAKAILAVANGNHAADSSDNKLKKVKNTDLL